MDLNELEYLENLAALRLDASERERLAVQLRNVLEYVRAIESVDTSGVEATSHVLERPTPMRPDVIEESYSQEMATRESSDSADGFFVVPPVMRSPDSKDRS